MSRVEENAEILKYLDEQLDDPDVNAFILQDPKNSVITTIACISSIMIDISKSLAVIADAMGEKNEN